MTSKLFRGLTFAVLAGLSLALAACGGSSGPGKSTIGGTVDVTKIVQGAPRAVSTTVVGGTVYVYDQNGILLNPPSGTAFAGNMYLVTNIPNGGPYIITVITGNAALTAYLPNLNGDVTGVNVNPYTTAVVKVLGAELGVPNLGTTGVNVSTNISLITPAFYTGVTTSTGVSAIAGTIAGTFLASFTSTSTGISILGASDASENSTAGSVAISVDESITTGTGTGSTPGNIYACFASPSSVVTTGTSVSCASYGSTGPTITGGTIVSSSAASVVNPAGTSGWGGYAGTISGTFGQSVCELTTTPVTSCPTANLLGICKQTSTNGTTAIYWYNSSVLGTVALAQATCLNEVFSFPSTLGTLTSTVTSTWSTTP